MRTPFFLLLSASLLLAACKPCDDPTNPECENYCDDPANPDCFNYDPCFNQTEVSADFEMAEILGSIVGLDTIIYIETDTALRGNFVRFRAAQLADRYEWHVGSDPRVFNSQEFRLFFQDPTQLLITLIVERKANTDCFPNDDGLDTLTKRLVIVPKEQSAIVGTYRGSTTANPNEIYELTFFKRNIYEDSTQFSHISVTGIHPGCDNTRRIDFLRGEAGYRGFVNRETLDLDISTGCFATAVKARLNPVGDSIEVKFRKHQSTDPYSPIGFFLFKGKRVQ
jgi:hypothetical protein